jgi:hypothetical protein
MQITDHEALNWILKSRLGATLDRIVPPTPAFADARYRSKAAARSSGVWRLAPALVGVGAIAIMAASATVATGSTNPAVWTERAASTIQAVRHVPEAKPAQTSKPAPSHSSSQGAPVPISRATPSAGRDGKFGSEPEAKDRPTENRPGPTPHPKQDPEPSDSHSSPGPRHESSPSPSTTGEVSRGERTSDFGGDRRF